MDVSWNGSLSPIRRSTRPETRRRTWAGRRAGQRHRHRERHREVRRRHRGGGSDPCGATLDNVSLAPDEHGGLRVVHLVQRQLRRRHLALGLLGDGDAVSAICDSVNSATSIAPQLSFNGSDMDMQGAAANPEFTGIESAAAYQAPFDFRQPSRPIQSGDNSFVIYLANTTGGGVSLEGNLSSSGFAGIWAAEAG